MCTDFLFVDTKEFNSQQQFYQIIFKSLPKIIVYATDYILENLWANTIFI